MFREIKGDIEGASGCTDDSEGHALADKVAKKGDDSNQDKATGYRAPKERNAPHAQRYKATTNDVSKVSGFADDFPRKIIN